MCVPRESGRLFTLFLTSPVMAMCALVDLKNADGLMLATCQVQAWHVTEIAPWNAFRLLT